MTKSVLVKLDGRYAKAGFTVIEMMIVVVLLGIIATLAAPSFRDYTLNQRVKNAAFDLNASLSNARSEAIKRNATVSVTAAGTGWADGWNIMSGTTTLGSQDAYRDIAISNGGGLTHVDYAGNGRTAQTSFTLSVAGNTRVAPRYVCISLSGQPFNQTSTCP
jgi:type IV fimbrial biogenesis protein FimT